MKKILKWLKEELDSRWSLSPRRRGPSIEMLSKTEELDSRFRGNDNKRKADNYLLKITGLMLCFLCLGLSGCVHVKPLQYNQYMLESPQPSVIHPSQTCKGILTIDNTVIAPPYAGTNFVYRIDSMRYITDYYNAFFIPPVFQFNQILTQYFKATQKFCLVTTSNNLAKNTLRLQVNVLDLYADYSDSNRPKAVLTLEFLWWNAQKSSTTPSRKDTFHEEVLLEQKDSASLVTAWNQALQNILKKAMIHAFSGR